MGILIGMDSKERSSAGDEAAGVTPRRSWNASRALPGDVGALAISNKVIRTTAEHHTIGVRL